VWRWVTSHLSYFVRVGVGGCWWGIDGVGQEPLGSWWCKRRENEFERLASRGPKYLAAGENSADTSFDPLPV
jgi:hypothetical protein